MKVGPGLIPTELWQYSLGDLLRSFGSAASPAAPTDTFVLPELGECAPVRSGRAGIVLALRALDVRPGARVGVPLYCCPVVFKAIVAAGCVPRFIDVDPETFCLSPNDLAAKHETIDTLVAVHMFGNICDMPALQEVMTGRPTIEDCAQSLGSTLHGRVTGAFGDIAVFSFRSGKYLSVGEGGALYSPRTRLRARLRELVSRLPAVSRGGECRHILKTYFRSTLRSRPLYGLVGHRLWQVYDRSVKYSAKSPLVMGSAFRSDLILASRRLTTVGSAIAVRRRHAEFYARSLKGRPVTLCGEPSSAFYNRYLFPILCRSTAQRDAIAAELFSLGIDTSKPYKDIARIAARYYGYTGDCPASEQVAERVLVVPSHEGLTDDHATRISRALAAAAGDEPSRLPAQQTRPAHV